ncbi:recombinase RecT [Enterovirga rhinocerotis]|uniref:RecT family protein n=1 Tax=Enterovirga rhinocerotis TaxID=1339210 RepID=A0A4R7BWR2_9HYPH|nr:recombinase RecT [Enterovirga rhinocerotis]TDR90340.1 RecT family protein [Enterovirga rhinocerotis]
MSQELATVAPQRTPIVAGGQVNAIVPATFEDVQRLSAAIFASGLVPYGMDRPEKVMVALMTGLELGIKPMQALQGIAVINGAPRIWGDLSLAMVRASGELEEFEERYEGKPPTNWADPKGDERLYTAICRVKRAGEKAKEEEFSIADAITAKLWGKSGSKGPTPWVTSPKRMLKMRARAFALRDTFADILKGMAIAEEMIGHEDETAEARPAKARRAPPSPPPVEAKAANEPVQPQTEHIEEAEVTEVATDAASAVAQTELTEDERQTPDEILVELKEKLGFAKTADQVEEFYDDFDAESLLEQTEDGVDRARALKAETLTRIGKPATETTPATAKPADPFDLPDIESPADYIAWIEGAAAKVVDTDTAKRMSEAWNSSKALRREIEIDAAAERKLKAEITSLIARFAPPSEKANAAGKADTPLAASVDVDAQPTSAEQYVAQRVAMAERAKTYDEARDLKRRFLHESKLREDLGVKQALYEEAKKAVHGRVDALRPADA